MNKKEFVTLRVSFLTFACALTSIIPAFGINPEINSYNLTYFTGAIQFPRTIEKTPSMRVYCSGHKIKCTARNDNKDLIFSIPEEKYKRYFYLLVSETVQFESEQNTNTVKFLKTNPKQPYKFYLLRLVQNSANGNLIKNKEPLSGKDADEESYSWNVEEKELPENGRIPDDAIIVCCNADFVQSLQGGNALEFPSIMIKENIVDLVGSEAKLHENSELLLLSLLDLDALHSTITQESRLDLERKTVVTLLT